MNYNGDRFVDLVMSDPAGSLALYERKRNTDGSLALLPEQRAFWSEGTSVLNSHGVPQNQVNPFPWVLSSLMIHSSAIQFPISQIPKIGFWPGQERNSVDLERRSCMQVSGSFREASDTSSLHWCLISPSFSLMPEAVCGVIGGESA
jgi:hypothetical protein